MKKNKFKSKVLVAVFLAATLQLSACTVGPDYVRPTAEVPAAYKEMPDWKKAQPKAEGNKEAWWEIFNDPRLNSLQEQVNISNQNIAISEAQLRQARALIQAARAGYYPSVAVGASATRSQRSANVGTGGTSPNITNDFLLPGTVSWELDLWGRIRRSVEASEAGAGASAADLAAVRLSAQAELAQDYFQLIMLTAQKELLDTTVAYYVKSLDLTKNRYNSGVAAKADVLQAEALLKVTQAEAIDLDVQYSQLQHAIALLLGKPASSFSISDIPHTMAPPYVPPALPSELLERRPDIASAERRVAAANAQIGVAEAAFFPTIKLSAAGGLEASSFAKWFSWPSRFWSVGPSISEQVFDGGLRGALSAQARAVHDETVAAYRQTVLTGFQEVEDNLAALRILEDESRSLDDAVRVAEQATTVITNQYKAGTVSYLNVITAQTAELAVKKTAIGTLGRRMTASVLLIKALGGGWHSSAMD